MTAELGNIPYPGLRSFNQNESHIFFGRDDQIDKLLEKLKSSHFVAVIGPSGCGKSSLVKAGLIPALKTGFFLNIGTKWRILEMRPGDKPFYNLATSINDAFQEDNPIELLIAQLKRSPKGVIEALKSYRIAPDENFLLIVDQFEELFRYKQNNNIEEVTAFISLLIAASIQREISFHVVITMRSDFLGDCSLFPGLPEILNDNQFLTPRLTREQTKEAIEGPAKVCGGVLTPQVVTMLLNDMGIDHDQLPILQHALMRMWNRALGESGSESNDKILNSESNREAPKKEKITLDVADYLAIGQLKNAITQHADGAYNKLNDTDKMIAEIIFKRLTERDPQQKDVRHPSQISDIAGVAKVSVEKVIEVAEKFMSNDYNFIVSTDKHLQPESFLDISHESIMRQWDRLRIWIAEEFASSIEYKRLLFAADNYFNTTGELLRGVDLTNALDWQDTKKPNTEWSLRYSQGKDTYNKVDKYLQDSKTKEARELQLISEKEEKEKKAKRNSMLLIYGILLITIFFLFFYSFKQKNLRSDYVYNSMAEDTMINDPTKALRIKEFAFEKDDNNLIKEDIKGLIQRNAFYKTLINGSDSIPKRLFTSFAISKSGKYFLTGCKDGKVILWTTETPSIKIEEDQFKDIVYSVAISKDEKEILTGSLNTTRLYKIENSKLKLTGAFSQKGKIIRLAFSNDNKYFLTGSSEGSVNLYTIGENHPQTLMHNGQITCLAFSNEGKKIVTCSSDYTVKYWFTDSVLKSRNPVKYYKIEDELLKEKITVTAVAFTPDNRDKVILGLIGGNVIYKNFESKIDKPLSSYKIPNDSIAIFDTRHETMNSIAFLNDANHIMIGSNDNTASIIDMNDYTTTIVLKGHIAPVLTVGYSPSKKNIFTCSSDNTIKSWISQDQNSFIADFYEPYSSIKSAAYLKDTTIITVSANKIFSKWKINDSLGKILVNSYKDVYSDVPINSIIISPSGKMFLTINTDNTIDLGCINKNTVSYKFQCFNTGHTGQIISALFSPNEERILTISNDHTAMLWTDSGKNLYTFLHTGAVLAAAFSADSRKIITGTIDGKVTLWTSKDKSITKNWERHEIKTNKISKITKINAVAFSASTNSFIIGCDDKTIIIGNTDSLNKKLDTIPQNDNIVCVAVSPDGKTFATAHGDGTIKLWGEWANSVVPASHLPGFFMDSKEVAQKPFNVFNVGEGSDQISSIAFCDNKNDILCCYGNKVRLLKIDNPDIIKLLSNKNSKIDRFPTTINNVIKNVK